MLVGDMVHCKLHVSPGSLPYIAGRRGCLQQVYHMRSITMGTTAAALISLYESSRETEALGLKSCPSHGQRRNLLDSLNIPTLQT